jgi:hypothetical protein
MRALQSGLSFQVPYHASCLCSAPSLPPRLSLSTRCHLVYWGRLVHAFPLTALLCLQASSQGNCKRSTHSYEVILSLRDFGKCQGTVKKELSCLEVSKARDT